MKKRMTVNEVMEKIRNENKKPFFSVMVRQTGSEEAETEVQTGGGDKDTIVNLGIAALGAISQFLIEYGGFSRSGLVAGFKNAMKEADKFDEAVTQIDKAAPLDSEE